MLNANFKNHPEDQNKEVCTLQGTVEKTVVNSQNQMILKTCQPSMK